MDVITVLVVAILINKSCSQILSLSPTCFSNGDTLTLNCETTAVSIGIIFYQDGTNKGGCAPGTPVSCGTNLAQSGTTTSLEIPSFNDATNSGNWTCEYGATPSNVVIITVNPCVETTAGSIEGVVTTEETTGGKSTSDDLETVDKVGIAIGSVAIVCFIAGAVFALYLNGLFCFATCRRRQRQQPEPEELLHPVIQKATNARAGSEVQLLPEMASIKNIVSTEWTHAGKKVTFGTDNELLRIDGTIPWVSPIDSGLWYCKLILKNANEKKFEIRLNVTVHQYTVDEGMRVQLLDYMKKSPTFQSVQWYHKGIKIPDDVHKYQGGSLQVPALYVGKLEEGDAGEYTCKIMLNNTTLEIPVKLAVKSTKGNSSLPPLGTPGLNTVHTATS